jgi:hypothetical protein
MHVPGPDKSKGKINFSTQSPFHNFINPLPSKVAPPSADHWPPSSHMQDIEY